eukprot:9383336-Alexandrium_andersonii.AAC.1
MPGEAPPPLLRPPHGPQRPRGVTRSRMLCAGRVEGGAPPHFRPSGALPSFCCYPSLGRPRGFRLCMWLGKVGGRRAGGGVVLA